LRQKTNFILETVSKKTPNSANKTEYQQVFCFFEGQRQICGHLETKRDLKKLVETLKTRLYAIRIKSSFQEQYLESVDFLKSFSQC